MNISTLPHASDLDRRLRRDGGALILGGAHGSLAIARSLGRRGIPVYVASDHPLVKMSRHVTRVLPWDVCGTTALPRLIDIAGREQLDGLVVFAGGDPELKFLAQNHAALSSIFHLTTPPWEVVQWCYDKHLVRRHAEAVGVDTPTSYSVRSRDDVERLDCRFPVVLKPAIRDSVNVFTQAKAWRADDRATLIARWIEAEALIGGDAIVVQEEAIPGGGETQFSHAGIWQRGEPVASLVARRLRQYPLEFGYTSTYVETVDCPPIAAASRRFLGSLGFTGIAEVEFKLDRRDGRYKLLDVNARAWTWTALGFAAGIDFPHALWRVAMDEPVAPTHAREAAWIHASRDMVAASQLMLRGDLTPGGYLRSLKRPLAFAAFAADDPIPGAAELPVALMRALTRRLPLAAQRLSGASLRRLGWK